MVTSLFPSPPRPNEGVFAERRWRGMAARGHLVEVWHPQPRAPWPWLPGLPDAWREAARRPAREVRGDLLVRRPRYLHLPGRARGNARRFAASVLPRLGPVDVVVCDYAWPAGALAPLLRSGRSGRAACVISGRGSDVLEVAGEAGLGDELTRCLEAAGHWCAVSRDLVERMDSLGGRPGHGVLVPNGVDTELFRPRPRASARRELGLEPQGPLVLVVGHLIPRKDPLLALRVFAAGAPTDARLVFVGRGPLESELCAAIEHAGLCDRARLVGEVPPEVLAIWLAAADLVLLTSRREGRPHVVLEALASGRPVLATAAGGTGELLGEGPMLATTRDAAALGRSLAALLASPPSAEALRARVAGLSWGASFEALEGCLRRAVAERGERSATA